MPLLHVVALAASAAVAGMMNSIAGGGTLLTFPALLWTGLDPKIANATSTLALIPGTLGGAYGYRHELKGSRSFLLKLCLPSFLGGGVGALLLLLTPSSTFAKLIPFLILFATVLFMVQERVQQRLGVQETPADPKASFWVGAALYQFLISVYGGYFGAGLGILMLAGFGFLGVLDIHRANGMKNILNVCINGVAAVGFILSHLVSWPEVLLMALASIAGGYGGAGLARRLGRTFVRRAVITIGLVIGGVMLWRAFF